jgi:hypothetical protein
MAKHTDLESLLNDNLGGGYTQATEVIALYEAEGHTVEHNGIAAFESVDAITQYAFDLITLSRAAR